MSPPPNQLLGSLLQQRLGRRTPGVLSLASMGLSGVIGPSMGARAALRAKMEEAWRSLTWAQRFCSRLVAVLSKSGTEPAAPCEMDGDASRYIQQNLACSLSLSLLSSVFPPISSARLSFPSLHLPSSLLHALSPVEPDVTLNGISLLQPYHHTYQRVGLARWTSP